MTGIEYQKLAFRTVSDSGKDLGNVGLGITGEAGEVADIIKKAKYHNHELDKEHLIKELGDCLWYIALGCELLDVSMDEVMQTNIDKLKARYPQGFATKNSLNRKVGDI